MEKDFSYLKKIIKDVPDFPKKGIIFKDITPLFLEPKVVEEIVDAISAFAKKVKADVIVGAESRGFLFSVPVSIKTGLPFVLVRKPNKLPRPVYSAQYTLEYGESTVQMHKDAIKPHQRVLIIDDLLATGGTVNAIQNLIHQANGIVAGSAFLIELEALNGKQQLEGEVLSLIKYDDVE